MGTFIKYYKISQIHKVLRISWLFVSLGIPPKIRFDGQNGEISKLIRYGKDSEYFRNSPYFGFTEFDILEKYRKSFNESELGKLHSVFPFECMAKPPACLDRRPGRRNRFSPSAKNILKAYTGFSDRQLVEHLNGNIHYQIFCGIMIPPSLPITNFKIVSAIRNEIASRLDIDSFQEVLASHWKPYLDNLHVCMTDATCYESHMRFPTDMKLLWESLEWLYRHICRHCRELGIRRPRNKYRNVAESICPTARKERGELQGQECLSAV